MTFHYPWAEMQAGRAATYREVVRLSQVKQDAARMCNFSLMRKAEERIKELKRQLGYRAWGKS